MKRGNLTVELVKKCVSEGLTDEVIGMYHGNITKEAVYSFRKRHNIPCVLNRHHNRNKQIRNMRLHGYSFSDIGLEFGLTSQAIGVICRKKVVD